MTIGAPNVAHDPDGARRRDALVEDLWRFYAEHAAQARQHETLRAAVTTALVGFAAALLGLTKAAEPDASSGAMLIVLGLLGALLNLKHYERNRFHTKVMSTVRDEITRLRATSECASTDELRRVATKTHRGASTGAMAWISRLRLATLWTALPMAVLMVGVLACVAATTQP
jgi:hypothetical protein